MRSYREDERRGADSRADDSRRSSYSAKFKPLPDCYFGCCNRTTSALTGLARIGLACFNIYLQLQSIKQENYFFHTKFGLFWPDVLVLISALMAFPPASSVRRINLQVHSLCSCIVIGGVALQLTLACLSIPLDGNGIDTIPRYAISKRTGRKELLYPGNNADPMISTLMVVVTSIELFILCIAVGIHIISLKKDTGGSSMSSNDAVLARNLRTQDFRVRERCSSSSSSDQEEEELMMRRQNWDNQTLQRTGSRQSDYKETNPQEHSDVHTLPNPAPPPTYDQAMKDKGEAQV